jgi:cytochrome c-type biogenesis protein CcmH
MTRALAAELRCPVCQGLSLQDSPSDLAQQMRAVIRDQLKAGKTPDQVRGYFLEKYGEWILLEPKPNGVNLLVYALPILALLGGLVVVGGAVRKWTAAPSSEPELADPIPPVMRAPDD